MIVRGEKIEAGVDHPLLRLDGKETGWAPVAFDKKHQVEHAALENGYLVAVVKAEKEETLLLKASGHSFVYLNGRTYPGDPYGYGFVSVPVVLEPGENPFLFRCIRGGVEAEFVRPTSEWVVQEQDSTLPDIVEGDTQSLLGAVVIINATEAWIRNAEIRASWESERGETKSPVVTKANIPPLSVCKAPFGFSRPKDDAAGTSASLRVSICRSGGTEVDAKTFTIRRRKAGDSFRRTFESAIDGSVQYYTVQPRQVEGEDKSNAGLILSLHGASVESQRQAECYKPKSWANLVAPTNRRPFGFDWEDWGRVDAMEVLKLARAEFEPDPNRIYLTGHSMGGHGTWQLGAHFPGIFAAIAPSAGWVSFFSYVGAPDSTNEDPVISMLRRAANASDTLSLKQNLLRYGIYVLHGDADDNVPVTEARHMREVLGTMHPNFAYYERPGAGHWWGDECMDWPPLMEFLRRIRRTPADKAARVDFVTMSPSISADCDWISIVQQQESMKPSEVHLSIDRKKGLVEGTTGNVRRIKIDWKAAYGSAADRPGKLMIKLDDSPAVECTNSDEIELIREKKHWHAAGSRTNDEKSPLRGGPFKTAFDHNAILVVGTHGTPAESAWAMNKARFDAEMFWYQGNGRLEIVTDDEFDAQSTSDRSVIIYGNSATNAAWGKLRLGDSPYEVNERSIRVGDRTLKGDNLSLLAIYPRPGSNVASVGIIAGTGLAGCRTLDRLPIFLSGVGIPDWVVMSSSLSSQGAEGILGAGFLGPTWQYDASQCAWRDTAEAGGATVSPEADQVQR